MEIAAENNSATSAAAAPASPCNNSLVPPLHTTDSRPGDALPHYSAAPSTPLPASSPVNMPPPNDRLCKQHAKHQRRRDRAIFIDRFSRVFFPLSFSVLNLMYWTVFVEYYY